MSQDRQTRREFCSQACTAAALTAIGGTVAVLQGCGGGGSPTSASGAGVASLPTVAGTASGGSIAVPVDAGSPLGSVGGVALVTSATGDVLVARTGQASFAAYTATCTHEGCLITGYAGSEFVCRCHGARFDQGGQVVSGPARTPLRSYPTQFAGGMLTIGG